MDAWSKEKATAFRRLGEGIEFFAAAEAERGATHQEKRHIAAELGGNVEEAIGADGFSGEGG